MEEQWKPIAERFNEFKEKSGLESSFYVWLSRNYLPPQRIDEPIPNGLPDDNEMLDMLAQYTTEVENAGSIGDKGRIQIKHANLILNKMCSLAEKEMIGFAEWLLEKSIKIRRDNISHWYVYQGKEYTTQQLLIKYRESCLKQ